MTVVCLCAGWRRRGYRSGLLTTDKHSPHFLLRARHLENIPSITAVDVDAFFRNEIWLRQRIVSEFKTRLAQL